MIKLKRTLGNSRFENLQRFFSLFLVFVLLSFVFLSPVLVGDHQCTDGHCIVCLLSSKISANLAAAVVFVTFVVSVTVFVVRHNNEKTCETLITLKRKLTN